LYFNEELLDRLRTIADKQRQPLSQMARLLLEDAIKKENDDD